MTNENYRQDYQLCVYQSVSVTLKITSAQQVILGPLLQLLELPENRTQQSIDGSYDSWIKLFTVVKLS